MAERGEDRHDVRGWTAGEVLRRRGASHGARTLLRVIDGEALSYAQADRLADRVARGLVRIGLGAGEHVAVLLPGGVEFVGTWLGAARAGVVHVPVNTEYRGVFLSHVLRDCGARVLVCDARYLDNVRAIDDELDALRTLVVAGAGPAPVLRGGRVDVLRFEDLLDAGTEPFDAGVSYRDIATIMYTSGTTGPAKGVLMPHAHDHLFGLGMVDNLGLGADDVYYVALPLFHANGLFMQLYGTMIAGGTAVLRERFSASRWLDDIREHGATVTNTLGVMNEFILSQPPTPRDRDHRLRAIAVAPNTPTLADDLKRRFGVRDVVGVYGMTEVNIPLHTALGADKPGSCGRAYARYFDVRVVDAETDEPLAPGETGELVVRPRQPFCFMAGYHGLPEETVRAWRNFWFHTGDAAYADEDGYVWFVDRIKDCIRRRGENISSFQIEAVLGEHPAVAEVAVIAVPADARGGEDEIKAVVVLEPGARATPEDLTGHCSGRVPAFAVPRYVEIVDALPKTPTEKVRKAALRAEGVTAATWDRLAAR